jgi:molybdopterin-guanine dinucleotide biosynthesis protein A
MAEIVRIFGVILAGGGGRRMGGADKALVPLAGHPLIDRVLERIEPQVEALAISANGDPARFAGRGLPVLPDDQPQGPLSGILAALDWAAPRGAESVVSVAVDTPFFPPDLVPRLLLAAETAGTGTALAESAGRLHPTFGLWPVALRGDLREALARGEARVTDFARRHAHATAHFPDDGAFHNINTPADAAMAEARLKGGA